jgi:DNA-binding CsgD family transcriptional regulator/PAS domain-containing protein
MAPRSTPKRSTGLAKQRARRTGRDFDPTAPSNAVSNLGGGPETPAVLRGTLPNVSTASLLSPLYDTIGNPGGWLGFLDALSHSYGGAMTCITSYDFANRTGLADATSGAQRVYETSYARHYASLNPWMGVLEQQPIGLPTLSDNTLPYADLLRTEFYNDWCRPQGIGGGVGVFVERNGRRGSAVSVLLSRSAIEQDPAVLSRLEILTPHILRVAQLHRQFAALEIRAVAAEGAIDRLAKAMLLLNAIGQVVYMNAQAESLVAAADGVVIRASRINLATTRETEALQQLIRTALSGKAELGRPSGGVMRVTRPSGEPAFELLVAPVPERIISIGGSHGFVAVFIQDPIARLTTPLVWLRSVFNLSPAEARLMRALLDGPTLSELTEQWRVGKETLRTQLRAIFAKTGTSSQAELIRVGLRSLSAQYR